MTAAAVHRHEPTARGRRRRRQIIAVAAELFNQAGYHRVTMDEIAVEAGLAKTSLYHYFPGKAKILYAIHLQFLPLLERAEARVGAGLSAAEELRLIIHDVIGFFVQHPAHMRVFTEHLRELDEDDRRRVALDRARYRHVIELALRRGSNDGEFRVCEQRVALMTFLGAVNWSYTWVEIEDPDRVSSIADALWDQLHRGLR